MLLVVGIAGEWGTCVLKMRHVFFVLDFVCACRGEGNLGGVCKDEIGSHRALILSSS